MGKSPRSCCGKTEIVGFFSTISYNIVRDKFLGVLIRVLSVYIIRVVKEGDVQTNNS